MSTKKSTKTAIELRRESQLKQIEEVIQTLTALTSDFRRQQKTLTLLESVSAGLYEEVDKLAKKSPADQVSPLVLKQVNDVIRESRDFASDDPFMKSYVEFVPAGDNPEQRDVVVVLRQIRQGLDRMAASLSSKTTRAENLLSDAGGIRMAILIIIEGNEDAPISHLRANNVSVSSYWEQNYKFNFSRLDRTDIPNYFRASE